MHMCLSLFLVQSLANFPIMTSGAPRRDASRSRSPLHGPETHNPRLSLGSTESPEFFTRWRPVLLMAQFRDLAIAEEGRLIGGLMNACRERSVPALHRREEQAIFTYTKFLDRHQLNFPFSGLETELLFQVEQTWGFILSPHYIKLTIPNRNGQSILLPTEVTVHEALDTYRPEWHREQDISFQFNQAFIARNQPYVFRIDCQSNAPIFPIMIHMTGIHDALLVCQAEKICSC